MTEDENDSIAIELGAEIDASMDEDFHDAPIA
jgi:hypothetical protein